MVGRLVDSRNNRTRDLLCLSDHRHNMGRDRRHIRASKNYRQVHFRQGSRKVNSWCDHSRSCQPSPSFFSRLLGGDKKVLVEKYRPRSFDEIVGHKRIVAIHRDFVRKRDMSNLLYVGKPGTHRIKYTSLTKASSPQFPHSRCDAQEERPRLPTHCATRWVVDRISSS